MGFRTGAIATVWETKVKKDTMVQARISTSRKNKSTDSYETDFSGWVSFCGTAAAKIAAGLNKQDRVKLGDVDVTNKYDKEKQTTYTNFTVWSCEPYENADKPSQTNEPQKEVDGGEPEDGRPY